MAATLTNASNECKTHFIIFKYLIICISGVTLTCLYFLLHVTKYFTYNLFYATFFNKLSVGIRVAYLSVLCYHLCHYIASRYTVVSLNVTFVGPILSY